jgi:signal transduction histidine kinase
LTAGEIETYSRERRYIRANGQTLWGKLTVSLVRDENGVPDHIIVQLMDITEQRQLAQMKGEFVATISHELRTPLTSVIGSLALLTVMDDEAFSDKAKRLLHVAQQNGKRLNVLIDDILDFEKFSAKQVTFNLSSENIAELVEDTLFTNSEFANKFGVRFELKCDDVSLHGSVDVKRFQQVMANLLSNAAKFAHDDTAIIAEVKDVAGCIEIAITNKGDGIPNEFRDRIFIPFAQAAESDNRNRGGTGLGLTITKQIVEQTGGQIGYESMPDGMTTFWFTVPYAEPAEVIVLSA